MTIPVIKYKTVEAVQEWFYELAKVDLLWHQDDSAFDVFDNVATAKLLDSQAKLARTICNNNKADIHELALKALEA